MGGRLLRAWIGKPLLSPALIKRRLNAVSELADNALIRGEARDALRQVGDMERLISRVVYGSAGARDLNALAASAEVLRAKVLLFAGYSCCGAAEMPLFTANGFNSSTISPDGALGDRALPGVAATPSIIFHFKIALPGLRPAFTKTRAMPHSRLTKSFPIGDASPKTPEFHPPMKTGELGVVS